MENHAIRSVQPSTQINRLPGIPLKEKIVNAVIKGFFSVICKIDAAELAKIPAGGPLLLVVNHINSIEVPIMITFVKPRPATGLAKVESWNNPFFNFLFTLWKGIPIQRGTADMAAMKASVKWMNDGGILAVSPEGTRSYDGQLLQAKTGILVLAVKAKAPIQPVVYYGHENFWQNAKHLRRTPFHVRVGEIFRLREDVNVLDRDNRQPAVDEIMYQMAKILPPEYRGVYADLSKATTNFIEPV
jgi:1-acyl-sn-glycerol-3-phosphate acyltransferase